MGSHNGNVTWGNYSENQHEEVDYMENRGGNLYSNTYNLRWQDHRNFK